MSSSDAMFEALYMYFQYVNKQIAYECKNRQCYSLVSTLAVVNL